jgi:hypothetical protein
VPAESVAVLSPEPLTEVGAEPPTCVSGSDADTDGLTAVFPT